MAIKKKKYPDGRIKEVKYPMEKQGHPFYFITTYNPDGTIRQAIEKPNLKLIGNYLHVSGAHVCAIEGHAHIDHFHEGKVWKEYTDDNLGFHLSGSVVVIQ